MDIVSTQLVNISGISRLSYSNSVGTEGSDLGCLWGHLHQPALTCPLRCPLHSVSLCVVLSRGDGGLYAALATPSAPRQDLKRRLHAHCTRAWVKLFLGAHGQPVGQAPSEALFHSIGSQPCNYGGSDHSPLCPHKSLFLWALEPAALGCPHPFACVLSVILGRFGGTCILDLEPHVPTSAPTCCGVPWATPLSLHRVDLHRKLPRPRRIQKA